MRDASGKFIGCRWPLRVAALGAALAAALATSACSAGSASTGLPSGGGPTTVAVDEALQVVGPSSGRFRYHLEVGAIGYAVLDTVVHGVFDEDAGAFEMTVDLREMVGAVPGLVGGDSAGLGEHMVIRGVVGRVFVRTEPSDRGWILFPGTIDQTVAAMGVHRPDAMLGVLDRTSDHVVAADGGVIDGAATTRYSGWIRGDSLGQISSGSGQGFEALSGVVPTELFDRLVRFDVWVDDAGRARRLVIEADLDSMAEVSRRIDGTDDDVDRLRLRHEIEWYDLDAGVTIDPPPRHEVSVIDLDALEQRGDTEHRG